MRMHFEAIDDTITPRPIFMAKINHIDINCMLDTGAIIPVFSRNEKIFKRTFSRYKGVTPCKYVTLSGFGNTKCTGLVYNVPEFTFSDGKHTIKYKDMKVLHVPSNMPCDLILPATMFVTTRYAIDAVSTPFHIYIEPTVDEVFTEMSVSSNGISIRPKA